MGLPATHGCVRLTPEDAGRFYKNIPDGTVVIIHGSSPGQFRMIEKELFIIATGPDR